jgi:hypothetical protein
MLELNDRFEIIDGKTFLRQHPDMNNCAIVALFNAYLDICPNKTYSILDLLEMERQINEEFEVDKRGIQITMLGHIAWKLGLFTSLIMSCHSSTYNQMMNESITSCIRIFGWTTDPDKKPLFHDFPNIENYVPVKLQNYYNSKNRTLITTSGIGCHATYVKDLNIDGTGMFINFARSTSFEYNWFKIGNKLSLESNVPSGTDYAVFLKPIEKIKS